MKIFHTGDWHIGKVFLNKNFISDQKEVLDKFINRVKREEPELIIIAGDIYDKAVPSVEAVELLNRTLIELVLELKRKVVLISGNHDSANRLSFGSEILRANGLYIVTDIESAIEPIEIEDEFGKVNIYAIPYISPMKARVLFPDSNIVDHDDIAKTVVKKIKSKWDSSTRNICIYHGFITSSGETIEESESERPLSIGGSDSVSVSYFEDFDYVALGHLHGPQKVKHEHIRYSGSLMKYSFSEEHQKKGTTKVILGEKKGTETDFSYSIDELYPSKDMRTIEGNIDELLEMDIVESKRDDYIMVRLIQDGELYSPKEKLDKLYPNILRIEVKRKVEISNTEKREYMARELESKNPLELFEEFYKAVTESELSTEKEKKLESILENIDMGGEAE